MSNKTRAECSVLGEYADNRSLVQVVDSDDKVFLDCLIALLYLDGKKHKILKTETEKYYNRFNLEGIDFPMTLPVIAKFLKKNAHHKLRVNIFILERDLNMKSHIYPLTGFGEYSDKDVNFLTVKTLGNELEVDKKANFSFFGIKSLDRFLAKEYSPNISGDAKKSKKKVTFCRRCFQSFRSAMMKEKHVKYCSKDKYQRVMYPEVDADGRAPTIQFKPSDKTSPMQITGFLDFESFLRDESNVCESCKKESCVCDRSNTMTIHTHGPMTYSLVFVDFSGAVLYSNVYSGSDVVQNLCNELINIEPILFDKIKQNQNNMIMSEEDEEQFVKATDCHICKKPFSSQFDKVRDHDHYNGLFLGAGHKLCNILRRTQAKIPIFTHNLSGYDSHLLIKHMKTLPKRFNVFAKNSEKLRAIDFNCFR